jgi:putative DNA primase/helicase
MVTTNIDQDIYGCAYTDAGSADALALLYGDQLKYVHNVGWHVWTGSYWKPDAENEAIEYVKKLARKRQALVSAYAKPDEKKDRFRLATRLEYTNAANACLKMAESLIDFSCLPDALDSNPMLLCCPNGTIDLSNGNLYPARPSDLITHITNAPYDPKAKAPLWEQFLDQIFITKTNTIIHPDYDLIDWIQKLLGYVITGYIKERCVALLWGVGGNGKTTFLNTVSDVLNTYAKTTSFNNFLMKRGDNATNDIAALRGTRLVTAVEGGQLRYLDEEKIKQLSGGDPVSCRFLYQESFSYFPTYKIFLACNDKPRIHGTAEAIWDRLKIIPFNARFEKGVNMDLSLPDRLKSERPGILAWIVQGCLKWQKEGLLDCDTVKKATKEYRSQEDAFSKYLVEAIQEKPGAFLTTQEVFNNYNLWARVNGEKEFANTTRMGMEMSNRGFKPGMKNNKRGFSDIEFTK